ncbi:unnamed protein product [Diamesa hyperborea]
MTLFFDTKVQFLDVETISTICVFHPNESLFAVASFGHDRGGSVTIFEDSGEPLRDVSYPNHPSSQATALCFHPTRQLLLSGWENGEIHAWINGRREFIPIQGSGLHKSPIMLIEFSEGGGRLVTADSNGTLTGWRCDQQGQFLTMFSHDLRDPLLHITFRRTVESSTNTELINLAKLAVAGDEVALDTLTNWRPRTAARNMSHSGVKDNHCFYVGSQSGILFYINQSGTCTEVLRTDTSPIIQILWHPKREAIVSLMEDMTVGHFLVESTGNLTELDRVKLSSRISGYDGAISWAGNSLAIITGDLSVRIWDIDTSDNFLLPTDHSSIKNITQSTNLRTSGTEIFVCIAYCAQNQTLCSGTNQGNIYIWKKTNYKSESENGWQLTDVSTVRGAIKQCIWGLTSDTLKPCIVVNCISNCYILKEQPLMSYHTRDLWVTQRSANKVLIENSSQQTATVTADISITNLCLTDFNLILTNGRVVMIYKIQLDNLTVRFSSTFNCENVQIFIYDQNIICMSQTSVVILSLNGVQLQEISFSDHEGKPIGCDLTNKFLTTFTINGYIKIYDVSRHEPKLLMPSKNAYDLFENFGEIIAAKCNYDGTLVALTIATENLIPDGKIYMWDIETNLVCSYDFLQKANDGSAGNAPRLPLNFFWDTDDCRLLACEARLIQQMNNKSMNTDTSSWAESQVYLVFLNDTFVKELEVVTLTASEQLINLCAPHVITLKVGVIGQKTLRDFVGLQSSDAATRKMVLNFSFAVAQGNMDQAFICIRSLQSEAVWTNLSKMCVQTGRLDVARICLGHLKQARSVRALRKAMEDQTLEPDARTAVLAIELGMIEEAENLYKKCGRFDLLNKMLQACGRFEEALKIAEQCDRVHLKNTYFKYAEWLRENGDIAGALKYYQLTNDPCHNITQMLMDDPIGLRKYMQSTADPEMLKWYAQYIESTGDMEAAFKNYQKAEDWFSQVRILCFLGQLSRADSVARHSGDRSACYHLARQYENIGKFQDAIQFYTRAKTYSNAVRICKENDLQDELWNVAVIARPRDKAIAAAYFEENGSYNRAVELYHRAGFIQKAIEMAFASQQPEILQVIASELNSKSDPELVERCAEFFQSIQLHQKAVLLLANTRQFEKALEVCSKHSVPITETLAEMLTPNKDEIPDDKRNSILVQLGDLLQEQGDYHSSTKKFTQAGDKNRAMKSLLKSGDTEKIIFFAGMSRQKEIYVMAANYLQSMDWQNDPKILKNIVTFYSKGQAYDLLANFYAVCAQAEIDEYRDYLKALKALQESAKCLVKISSSHLGASENLQLSILDVKKFMELQELAERREFNSVMNGCRSMLSGREQPPTRHSDILGLLVECQVSSKQYPEALQTLRELSLKQPDWSIREIVDRALIEKLSFETGVDFNTLWSSGRRQLRKQSSIDQTDDEDDEEEIEEQVES